MAELIFEQTGESVELPDGAALAAPCEEAGLPLACSEGICGTCIVEVVEGGENLSDPTQAEIDFLGKDGVKKERMMCQSCIRCGKVKLKF